MTRSSCFPGARILSGSSGHSPAAPALAAAPTRAAAGRHHLGVVPLLLVFFSACALPSEPASGQERAQRLHSRAIIIDTHIDAPWQLQKEWADLAESGATPHFDIPRAREGGLTAAFFAVYVPSLYDKLGGSTRVTLDLIDLVHRVVREHPEDLIFADSVAGIRRAKRQGKIGILMGIEGGHAIEDTLGALRAFYQLGIRYMTLTHVNTNHWADSSGPFYLPDFDPEESRVHQGLNDFGRKVVEEMNRLGMMIDISHVSDETLDDVLEASVAPVMASHSSCKVFSDIPRNLTDEQIRRIAAKGGVVMINFGSYFLDQEVVDTTQVDLESIREEYLQAKRAHADDPEAQQQAIRNVLDPLPDHQTSWTRVIDHLEHIIEVAGPDAVGLGSDFDGVTDPPEGLEDVSKLQVITEELLRRGHSEEEILKVLGENFLRFFAQVEEVSRSLADQPPVTATLESK